MTKWGKLTEMGIFEKQSKQRGLKIEFITNSSDKTSFFYIQNADKTIETFRIRKEEEIARGLKKREKRLKEKGLTEEEIAKSIKESYSSFILHPFQTIRSLYKIKSASWTTVSSSKLELVLTTSSNTIEYYSIPYEKETQQALLLSRHILLNCKGKERMCVVLTSVMITNYLPQHPMVH